MSGQDGVHIAQRRSMLRSLLLSQRGRTWRTSQIADILGVSPDTAARDMRELSASGTVPLSSSGTTADFVWEVVSDARTALEPLQLDYAQGTALYAALRLLGQQQDERNDVVRATLTELIRVLPAPLRPHVEATVIGLGHQDTRQDRSAIFTALSQGWLGQRMVRLTYKPPRKQRFTCSFAPYLVEPSGIGYTIYFIGHSDPPRALRTYRLERILSAELTNETFEIPPDFDGAALLSRAWGVMYGDGDLVRVTLRFNAFVSQRVRETRWHPSERVTETPEGLVWEADIGDITEIRPWVRGWGADCEVLEPQTLREEMMKEARRLARLYDRAPRSTATASEPDAAFLRDVLDEED